MKNGEIKKRKTKNAKSASPLIIFKFLKFLISNKSGRNSLVDASLGQPLERGREELLPRDVHELPRVVVDQVRVLVEEGLVQLRLLVCGVREAERLTV